MHHVTNLTIPEVIERAQKLETNKEKVRFISMYRNRNFAWLINRLYHNDDIQEKNIKVPKFTPSKYPVGMNPLTFKNGIVRFENAVKWWDTEHHKRAENNLMLVLEGVSQDEAELFVMILSNKKKFEGISKSVWKEVFPDLFQLG